MKQSIGWDGTSLSHKTTELSGTRLHYVLAGSGAPVLLWHGFLGTWFTWRKLIPLLASNHTVIVPDMRGYGDSDKPASGYDGLTLLQDFRALVGRLRVGPLHVVAHDMGAPPALLWAGMLNDEIRTLTYLDEPVLTNECLQPLLRFQPEIARSGGLWWWPFAFATDMPERLVSGREREFLSWFSQNYIVQAGAIEEEAEREYLRTFSGVEGVRGAFGVYRSIFETIAQTELLRQSPITIPVLALGGSASIGEGTARMMSTIARHVEGGVIEACGHFIPEEQPAELYRRLVQFWKAA